MGPILSSKMFLNDRDHKQFQIIFTSIDESQLIQQLNVSHVINKEIAEYAVGQLEYCRNNECKQEIIVLENDIQLYLKLLGNEPIEECEIHHSIAKQVGFGYCSTGWFSASYYCLKCVELTQTYWCECDSDYILYLPSNSSNCSICDDVVIDCYCSLGEPGECGKCRRNMAICKKCSDNWRDDNEWRWRWTWRDELDRLVLRRCVGCNLELCSECIGDCYYDDYDCICKQCENQHPNCSQCDFREKLEWNGKFKDRFYRKLEMCDGCNADFCFDCYEYRMSKCAECHGRFCYECTADHAADISRCKQSKQQITTLQLCKWNEYELCNGCCDEVTKL